MVRGPQDQLRGLTGLTEADDGRQIILKAKVEGTQDRVRAKQGRSCQLPSPGATGLASDSSSNDATCPTCCQPCELTRAG